MFQPLPRAVVASPRPASPDTSIAHKLAFGRSFLVTGYARNGVWKIEEIRAINRETRPMKNNLLYYGDNYDILRRKIKDESVDLCYIDPPFNSKRNYNQIYNNIGGEDRAQAQAFSDTWNWDSYAIAGYEEILANAEGRFQPQLVELMKGLGAVLRKGSLLAYLVSMSLRITEIHRVLKRTGSFYLHCDPTASHYLKLVLDAVFVAQGGDYINEITWKRSTSHGDGKQGSKHFGRITDIIFFYTKSDRDYTWNPLYEPYTPEALKRDYNKVESGTARVYRLAPVDGPGGASKGNPYYVFLGVPGYWRFTQERMQSLYEAGRIVKSSTGKSLSQIMYLDEAKGRPVDNFWGDINKIAPTSSERLGYPTQKPERLLERIILASSNVGDVVLDAYCGCGTTVAVAQRLRRKWIGMDITYQSIALILKRLEDTFDKSVADAVILDGVPRDMESAIALAHKKDDRLRKEFEKWVILTYTNNRAVINDKKGADAGIDARAFFLTGKNDNAKIIFQAKSGGVKRGDIATLRGDMGREGAALAVLISLEPPSAPMIREAKEAGRYRHEAMGRSYDCIRIVTVKEIVEGGERLEIPMSREVLAAAQRAADAEQIDLLYDAPPTQVSKVAESPEPTTKRRKRKP